MHSSISFPLKEVSIHFPLLPKLKKKKTGRKCWMGFLSHISLSEMFLLDWTQDLCKYYMSFANRKKLSSYYSKSHILVFSETWRQQELFFLNHLFLKKKLITLQPCISIWDGKKVSYLISKGMTLYVSQHTNRIIDAFTQSPLQCYSKGRYFLLL